MDRHQEYLKFQDQQKKALANELAEICEGYDSITLEIGCGHGHYLVAYAEQHPDTLCLGFDLQIGRIVKARDKAAKRSLNNLHFIKAEASILLEMLPSNVSLEAVFLLFSDPWPKARHHKHRVVQHAFLDMLAKCTAAGAPLYFRTDDNPYFDWTLEHIEENANWAVDSGREWPLEQESVFQMLKGAYQSLIVKRL